MSSTSTRPTMNEGGALAVHFDSESRPWRIAKIVTLHFLCAYLLLYAFPGPFLLSGRWFGFLNGIIWQAVASWTAKNVLHVNATIAGFGGGDAVSNYVRIFCCF